MPVTSKGIRLYRQRKREPEAPIITVEKLGPDFLIYLSSRKGWR